ncbi:MAG: hemerythrin domain-containing protein [Proteobacteria bacterium]|nr:hemerythrin domain-containing protein [Pseudomonadota bacterium]
MTDPVKDLAHDHTTLNARVIALGARLADLGRPETAAATSEVADDLGALREELFHHFAREEEGLFPFVAEAFPDQARHVDAMALAHDGICGALARAYHLAADDADLTIVLAVYARFEAAYAAHARFEAALFDELGPRLTGEHRDQLAALVRDL